MLAESVISQRIQNLEKIVEPKMSFSNQEIVADLFTDIVIQAESTADIVNSFNRIRDIFYRNDCKMLFEKLYMMMLKADWKGEARKKGFELRYDYVYEDFTTAIPYHEIVLLETEFERQVALESLTAKAKECGFSGFKKAYQAYEKSMRLTKTGSDEVRNPTDFPWQPLELEAGEWFCDSEGVKKITLNSCEVACQQPVMPVERLVNIDTGVEKLKIAFLKGEKWREFTAEKRDLFDSTRILKFASLGLAVTSKSARLLSEYICSIESLNIDRIPEKQSVSRLGYISNNSFAPYVDGLEFDGIENFRHIYNSVRECGDYDKWLDEAVNCRNYSKTAQIMLASSFASPLIKKIGCLPFFVHLWGIESGTGKTVALMLSASVWGSAELGEYIQTFNATQVGHEKTASFLNNLPMCIDELQLSKDSHGRSRFDVYQLAQGTGRTRGTKYGGIEKTPTWSLCVLSTGESPIVQESAGAGAVNRVIDIECRTDECVIEDGYRTSACVKQNFGFAGRRFIECLTDEVIESAKTRYSEIFRQLSSGETTEKQAMSASLIVLADELADKFIFHTGKSLTVADISEFLKSKRSVSAGQRGYDYMCQWISANSNKFICTDPNGVLVVPKADIFGVVEDGHAFVNAGIFRKYAKEGGFDDRALLSWLKSKCLIQTRNKGFTKNKRINGINTDCIVMQLNTSSDEVEYPEMIP